MRFIPAATIAFPVAALSGAPPYDTALVPSATALTASGPWLSRSSRMEGVRNTRPPLMKGRHVSRVVADGGLGVGDVKKVKMFAFAKGYVKCTTVPIAYVMCQMTERDIGGAAYMNDRRHAEIWSASPILIVSLASSRCRQDKFMGPWDYFWVSWESRRRVRIRYRPWSEIINKSWLV